MGAPKLDPARPVPVGSIDPKLIPAELAERNQWVGWRYECRDDNWTKVLIQAQRGPGGRRAYAKSNTSSTWSSLESALAAYRDPAADLDGVGYVFSEDDPFCGIDFDLCLARDGSVLEWAREWIAQLPGYAEISPSGRGLKVFIRGKLPIAAGKSQKGYGPDGTGGVEAYSRLRFFTVTTRLFDPSRATINADPADTILAVLHPQWFPDPAGNDTRPGPTAKPQEWSGNERDLIERRVLRYLAKCEPSISGSLGHNKALKAACKIGPGFNLSPEIAYELLRDNWNLGCQPPWSDRDLRRKVDQAYKVEDRRGWLLDTKPAGTTRNRATAGPRPGPGTADYKAGGSTVAATDDKPKPTDLGNAHRLVRLFGDQIRYAAQWGKWLCWDGRRWKEDATIEVFRLAEKAVRSIGAEASATEDDTKRTALLKWAVESESAKRINAMVHLARFHERIILSVDQLDPDPWLLNCRNGTIDLTTGTLRPHQQADLITKMVEADYEPAATCPRWERFESEIMDGDPEMVEYIRRIVGYGITADVREHCLFFFYGGGRNGKSLYLNTVQRILADYATTINASLLTVKRQDEHPTELMDLMHTRFVSTIEVADGKRMAETLVKQITGGDFIKARRMHKDPVKFAPTHKLILAANCKPEIEGTDEGIWERIKLIPFPVTFVEKDRVDPAQKRFLKDKNLDKTLMSETPGILAQMVRSCLTWQRDGLGEPAKVVEATASYRAEMDEIERFMDEKCVRLTGIKCKASALYESYMGWCKANGIEASKVSSSRKFGGEMEQRGYRLKKSNSVAWREGIAVPDDKRTTQEDKDGNPRPDPASDLEPGDA